MVAVMVVAATVEVTTDGGEGGCDRVSGDRKMVTAKCGCG